MKLSMLAAKLPGEVAVGYTHYRLTVTDNYGDTSYCQIPELELLAEDDVDQLIPGATTSTASGQYSSTYGPEKAFDNNNQTKWLTTPPATAPCWIAFSFPEKKDIKAITIQGVSSTVERTRMPANFTLAASDNGADWTDLKTWSGGGLWNTNEKRRFDV